LKRYYRSNQRKDKLEIWVLWGNAVVWIPGLIVTLIAIVEFWLLLKKCE
jgi:hypothetical protein